MPYHVHAFVDGGYLAKLAQERKVPLPDPRHLAEQILRAEFYVIGDTPTVLTRVTYYDASPQDPVTETPESRLSYWEAVEALPDTALGFGFLRARRGREPRQKAVDTLMAVDMVVGAFTGIFSVALLIAGDSDFVPVVDEVRRRGVLVLLAADRSSVNEELLRSVDRFVPIGPESNVPFAALTVNGRTWPT